MHFKNARAQKVSSLNEVHTKLQKNVKFILTNKEGF